MNPDDVIARLLNGPVLLTMIVSGIAYGLFLWSLDLRPAFRLFAAAVFPGAIFLAVIWAIRGFQGTLSLIYVLLIVDWLIFSNVSFLFVMIRRRWHGRNRE
jgi:fatty acid desaturase